MVEHELESQTAQGLSSGSTNYQLWDLGTDAMMFNFMCQLDCSIIIQGVFVRVLLDEITI